MSTLSGIVWAQTASTGTVLGLVTDPTGAVVPGATVELVDAATKAVRSVTTNAAGRYAFVALPPGTYSIRASATGFKQAVVPAIVVEVTKSYTVNLQLAIGESRLTIEVTATPGAELQTLDSTVGSTIGGDDLLSLPSLQRNVTSFLTLQATSMPQQGPGQSSYYGGQVAGAKSDQNTIMLDGGNVTSSVSGNSDYYTNYTGAPEAPIPTPVESIQEFRVATTNHTASFTGSSGSQTVLVTKRGGDQFHGSAYEYLQNSDLNANGWNLNRIPQPRPQTRDNRFGGTLGGYIPGLPEKAKTYFFADYEGRRMLNRATVTRIVPTDTMKQGILRFRDAAGNLISYNIKTSMQCGTSGNTACDPRGIGLNPLINQMWSKYEPVGNNPSSGDGLNTIGFTGAAALPVRSDFGVIRMDHAFGSNWQFTASYRHYVETAAVGNRQVDIGGLLPGDTLGQIATTSGIPRQPRYFVAGLTGMITPSLTSETSVSYLRDWWLWKTAGSFPQVPGTTGSLLVGGDNDNELQPITYRTNTVRQRAWGSQSPGVRENLSWQKGTHLLRFGATWDHTNVHFWRDDGQGSLTVPEYNISVTSGLNIPSTYRPPTCAGTLTTNCLPSNQSSNWNTEYAEALGLVDQAVQLGARGSDLSALPAGTPLTTNVYWSLYSFYATDSWHVLPTLTINYGLNWGVDVPAQEANGKQIIAILAGANQILDPVAYLQQRQQAALNGQVYNPLIGMEPIKSANRTYPYNIVYKDFAPRIAVAWNPKFSGGAWGWLFGNGKTVLRGGYARLYDRLNGVQKVINPLQALGFGQTLTCLGPSTAGQCLGSSGVNPATAFRVGVDGSAIPIPPLSATATVPMIPGNSTVPTANQPFTSTTYNISPSYEPSPNNSWNFTIQREMPGNSVLEIGYVRRTASELYAPADLNQVPFFMKSGGQTLAQAFDAVAAQLRAGSAVTAQPFFESALAGSSLCKAPNASCTAGVVASYSSNFLSQQVRTLWNASQPSFATGPGTATATQMTTFFVYTNRGWSNYNSGFVSYRTRNWKGVALDANFTYAHSLDASGWNQDQDTAGTNAFDLHYDYGTSIFDRKYVFNLLGSYQLPFGHSGNKVVDQITGGWSVAPIFSAYSGLPLKVTDGSSQEYGQGTSSSAGAIPLVKVAPGNSVHSGVIGNTVTQVGTSGNPATGGTGLNIFADPSAVYSSFRPIQVSVDTTSMAGILRGMAHWNLDLSVARKFKFTERLSATFTAQFFNIFNHVMFADPGVSLQAPTTFGVIGSQFNAPRIIELGLRLGF
ncbi:MAG: carboxypeptidase-like regulatory domain-containing protein [Bryobacteraceae bacterium]